MDFSKVLRYLFCLIVSIGLDLVCGQPFYRPGYGRRNYLGPGAGIYPRRYPRIVDPLYPRPRIMPRMHVPDVFPVAPVVRRRPEVVSDRSERNNINLNIHNENNNVHDQRGSGRVSVSQGSSCETPCPTGFCPNPFEQCVHDTQCPGDFGCRESSGGIFH